MASNLRAKPIEGYVTDSAGNILRNAQIIVKQETPNGSFVVNSVKSDDSGYFITNPIPNGTYAIYESGIIVSRIIHSPDQNSIQAFKANTDNYPFSTIQEFASMATARTLNQFRSFVQIESSEKDISQFGNTYPIYDFNITADPSLGASDEELFNLAGFLGLSDKSRITTTRFDVEYYFPLTGLSKIYKRIRWAGVPAIRFFEDSRLVIPLDYFSIVPSLPRVINKPTENYNAAEITVTGSGDVALLTDNGNYIDSYLSSFKVGDLIKVILGAPSFVEDQTWYGILAEKTTGPSRLYLEKWQSSRYTNSIDLNTSNLYVRRIIAYDGMFPGMLEINEDSNERFTITENLSAQNNDIELYNYNNKTA